MKTILRVSVATALCLAMLSFLTMEKISYFWTVHAAGRPQGTLPAGSIIVLLLLLGPYFLALLEGLWKVSFLAKCHDSQLPPLHNIVLGVLSSVLESACLVWFQSLVVPYVPVYVALPAMSGVLPASCWAAWLALPHGLASVGDKLSLSTDESTTKGRRALSFLASFGCVMGAVVLYLWGSVHWFTCVVMVVSLIMLAIIWSPGVQYRTFSADGKITHNCKKLKVMYTFLKVLCIVLFFVVDVVAFSPADQALDSILVRLCSRFSDLKDPTLVVPLLINIGSGLFMHGLVHLSIAFCQPTLTLIIPSVLSTIISTGLFVGLLEPYIYHADKLAAFGDVKPFLLSGGILVCVWILSYALLARDALHRPGHLFTPSDHVLLDYGWCPGFSDLRRLLSYCARGVRRHDNEDGQRKTATKSRVYICTTMYREADYEMERLLLSLQRMSGSECLQDVYLEAHIFMDNGINDTRLGDFALQLVGLLINRIGMDPGKARCLLTPYGLQILSYLPGGMPLFVHLKDSAKVKPKKRWSQCMYINYIMNFRKALWQQDETWTSLSNLKHMPDGDVYFDGNECPDTKTDTDSLKVLREIATHMHNGGNQSSTTPHDTCTYNENETTFMTENGVSAGVRFIHTNNVLNTSTEMDSFTISHGCCNNKTADVEVNAKEGCPQAASPYAIRRSSEHAVDDDHTYILATDADMDFQPEAVADLLLMCTNDLGLGAACGRTHPVGYNCSSIVWHQIFEYAKDFWMIKSAQNVIGSVMCCPGCFSLYRASAIRQVMDKYATPTKTPFTVYVKDTGEDRWMATLMMIQGWRLAYSAFADNTTYCPDTFDEFFKQRRRWILSDIANLILVVQNFPRLLRHNQCFSLVYVLYLLNMFLNNVITPGTAIVMITAGMELVFGIPYIYTTPPLTLIVYGYAIFCTRFSTRDQTLLTSLLTLLLGGLFASVAVWGSFKIVDGMITEMNNGNFQFQQHYIILMLTMSLLYAALVHPRETYQIVYGLAYLFIFPAMHLLLPIYSIANIIDQSWGTRESQTANIPKVRCLPNLKNLMKRRNKKAKKEESLPKDAVESIQQILMSVARSMDDGTKEEQGEDAFWENLRGRIIGNDVNLGLEKAELSNCLERLRNYSLLGLLFINTLWLAILSYFYVGIDSPLSRLNLYGLISGALYGFTLIIQVVGMTVCRVNHGLVKLARYLYGDKIAQWVRMRENKNTEAHD